MSFLWRSAGRASVQLYHLSPISRVLFNPRVKSPTLQQLRRPFNSSAPRLAYFQKDDRHGPPRSVKPRNKPPIQPQKLRHAQYEHYDDRSPPPPPPPPPPQFVTTPDIVVGGLVGICVAMYGYYELVKRAVASNPSSETKAAALRTLEAHFVHSPKNTKEGRYYTLITSAFMHTNLAHLLFNTIGLWTFGRPLVSLVGAPSFLVLYFGSVVAGGLFQDYMWGRQGKWNVGAVGASGGVLGIFAATTCMIPRSTMGLLFIPMPMWVGAAITVGTSVGGMQDLWLPSLGHADHLGGMAFGALWWLVTMRRGRLLRMR